MKKIFFTDTTAGLTKRQAQEMGVVMIDSQFTYKGEVIHDYDDLELDDSLISTAPPNAEMFREAFEPYIGNQLIYVTPADKSKPTQLLAELNRANIPNVTVIDSGFIAHGQLEVLKRVMANRPYNDIKYFFVVSDKKPTKSIPTVKDKFCLFTMEDGQFKLLETFDTKFAAVSRLKKLVNSKLFYRKDLNYAIGRHCGQDYVGGLHTTL